MRAYVVHNVDGNEDLLANLETAKSEAIAAQELVEEGVSLLKKAEEGNEASQAEAHRLAEEKAAMMVEKENVEKEVIRLRQELKNP